MKRQHDTPINPLTWARRCRGISRRELAGITGKSPATIAGLELGFIQSLCESYRTGLEEAGIDFDALRVDLDRWHADIKRIARDRNVGRLA